MTDSTLVEKSLEEFSIGAGKMQSKATEDRFARLLIRPIGASAMISVPYV
jgi:hypothetical protein